MRVLIVGGPSSGKTTQRKLLARKFSSRVTILDSEQLPDYFYDLDDNDRRKTALDEFERLFATMELNQNEDTASDADNGNKNDLTAGAKSGRNILQKQKQVHTQFNRQFDLIVVLYVPGDILVERKLKEIRNSLHLEVKPEDANLTEDDIREKIRESGSCDFCSNSEPVFPRVNFDAIPVVESQRFPHGTSLILPINGHGPIQTINKLIHSFTVSTEALADENFHQAASLFQEAAMLAAELQEKKALAAALVGEGQAHLSLDKVKVAAKVFSRALELDVDNGNAIKCLQVVRKRAETKLLENINRRKFNPNNRQKTTKEGRGEPSPFQMLVAKKMEEKSKVERVIEEAREFEKQYIDPLDENYESRMLRKKYRAYTQDMNRDEVTRTIVKHMTPAFVANAIDVAVYKHLFARATDIQKRRAREREFAKRRQQVRLVKARRTRLAGLKFKKTKTTLDHDNRRRAAVGGKERLHPTAHARFDSDLAHLKKAIEDECEHTSYKDFFSTNNHLVFKHLCRLTSGMVVESKHPYAERTHNIVEIVPNDTVFEKKNLQAINSAISEEAEYEDDEEGRPESDSYGRRQSNVESRSNTDTRRARITKNDIKSIVKMVDKLTDGNKRVRFQDVSHTYRIYARCNACKREHLEGRQVVKKLWSILMAEHMTKVEFFNKVKASQNPTARNPSWQMEEANAHSIYSDKEHQGMKQIMDYIRNNYYHRRSGNLSRGVEDRISLVEFEQAVRRSRRAKACTKEFERGRKLALRLERLIDAQDLTINEWFRRVDNRRGSQYFNTRKFSHDSGKSGPSGGISAAELTDHLNSFHRRFKNTYSDDQFTREEVEHLIQFMDPNGDGQVTISECNDAFSRCHLTSKELAEEHIFATVVTDMMEKSVGKGMGQKKRIVDLYRELEEYMDWVEVKANEKINKKLIHGLAKNRGRVDAEDSISVGLLHDYLCTYENDDGDIFTYDEINSLVRFMDPNKDGQVDLNEYKDSFRRANSHPNTLVNELEFGRAMSKFEALFDTNQGGSIDYVKNYLDQRGGKDGSVSLREFELFLERTVYDVQRQTMKGSGFGYSNFADFESNDRRKNGLYFVFNNTFTDMKAGDATIDIFEDDTCANRLIDKPLRHDDIQRLDRPVYINSDRFVLKFKSKAFESGSNIGKTSFGWQCLVFSAEDRKEVDKLVSQARIAAVTETVLKDENELGENVVSIAVFEGNEEAANYLLGLDGADVNMADKVSGNTLLHDAARGGHASLVKKLIEMGANIKVRNWQKETPLFIASRNNNPVCAKMILDAASKLTSSDELLAKKNYGMLKNIRGRTAKSVVEKSDVVVEIKNRNRPQSAKLTRKKGPGIIEMLEDCHNEKRRRPQSAACYRKYDWGHGKKQKKIVGGSDGFAKTAGAMLILKKKLQKQQNDGEKRPSTAPASGSGWKNRSGGVSKLDREEVIVNSPSKNPALGKIVRPITAGGKAGLSLLKGGADAGRRPRTAGGNYRHTIKFDL